MIHIAIAGLGNIGRVHAANLATMRGCRVAGVFDTNPLALALGPASARRYEDASEMIADATIDAIVIATPADSHRALAEAALQAGKHVFVEKPLATTLEDAAAIVAAARGTTRVAQAGFCERFNPQYMEAKRAVQAGALGRLRSIQTSRVAPFSLGNAGWKLGVLDTAVHNLDLILWLKGSLPARVKSYGTQVYPESDLLHSITTVLEFGDGAIASDHIAWIRDDRHPLHACARSKMMAIGEKGVFEVDLGVRPSSLLTEAAYTQLDTVILGHPDYYSCLRLQLESFLRCIEDGAPVLAPLSDAMAVERVVLAAQQSLETGREVAL